MANDPILQNIGEHVVLFLGGATGLGIVAHMVNTFPTPKSKYWQWFLGTVKFIVGQRVSAANAFNGLQTESIAITNEQKQALANGSTIQIAPKE